MLGEAPFRLLREEHLPVRKHVELSRRPGDRSGGDVELRGDLGRETRGPGVVPASGRAVEDLDGHERNNRWVLSGLMTALVFEVEQAGCTSCAARVREALAPLAVVSDLAIDESADSATVHLASDGSVREEDVNRVLLEASQGSGHLYRVKPGSWRAE